MTLGELGDEGVLGLGFGGVFAVGGLGVDGLAEGGDDGGAGALHEEGAGVVGGLGGVALEESFVEVVPVEVGGAEVAVFGAVEDADDGEVEVEGVDDALQGELVADLEAFILGELAADDDAVEAGAEGVELVGGYGQLGINVEEDAWVDGELGKAALFLVAVFAAVPGEGRDQGAAVVGFGDGVEALAFVDGEDVLLERDGDGLGEAL